MRVSDIDAEGRLSVGPSFDEAMSSTSTEDHAQSLGSDIASLILERNRWHRQPHVSGQHAHDSIDVAIRERGNKPLYESHLGG